MSKRPLLLNLRPEPGWKKRLVIALAAVGIVVVLWLFVRGIAYIAGVLAAAVSFLLVYSIVNDWFGPDPFRKAYFTCGACGTEVARSSKRCPGCGAALSDQQVRRKEEAGEFYYETEVPRAMGVLGLSVVLMIPVCCLALRFVPARWWVALGFLSEWGEALPWPWGGLIGIGLGLALGAYASIVLYAA